ncbi:MAG: hypothetical protein V2I27_01470 [Erythrobacter sp.]|jgi:hypothetical protein|nr:hypothetical protein [Erythrobacter sp.]
MSFPLAALVLLQAAAAPTASASGSAADTAPGGQRIVGVSVSASATVLAPVRIVREPATGALQIEGQKAEAQSRRDDAGMLWIEFS